MKKRHRIKQAEESKGQYVRKGVSVLVQPIRDPEDIERIKILLKDKARDLALFVAGINNGLRIGDLLNLKVGEVKGLKAGEYCTITEQKTGKRNVFLVNNSAHKALRAYLDEVKPEDDARLFPITIQRAHQLVKAWTREAGLKGNYGTHSLRKTFGYQQRKQFGVGYEILAKRFNHSSPAVTMRYLGIEDKEVNGILMNEI